MERIVVWLTGGLPSCLWSIVGWITFFFKLTSLAFVVPIIGLIIFDFCLWLWRLYRPSLPADSVRSRRVPRNYVQQQTSSARASTAVIEIDTEPQTIERRSGYGTVAGD